MLGIEVALVVKVVVVVLVVVVVEEEVVVLVVVVVVVVGSSTSTTMLCRQPSELSLRVGPFVSGLYQVELCSKCVRKGK